VENDFVQLVEAARMAQAKSVDMWKAALSLPTWFFVGDPQGDYANPVVGVFDGQPHLLAFTDEEQAQAMALRRASRQNAAAAPAPVLRMTPVEAMARCKKLSHQGVKGILFNTGPSAFHTSLARLFEMHKHPGKQPHHWAPAQ